MRTTTLLFLFLALATVSRAQTGIGFYDVDRLYDTVPALFYNDSDYTPEGRYRWTAERYRRKVANTAAVIDSMALDIVALWGVENEAVVRDIAAACSEDYSYLHRTLNTLDGMEFALLYFGDRFYPEHVDSGRRYLYVEGLAGGERVGIVMIGEQSAAQWIVEELRAERPDVRIIALGRTDGIKTRQTGLEDALAKSRRAGRGTVRTRSGWRMRDGILLDTALNVVGGDVFARRFMLDPHSGAPRPTYSRGRYTAGYSYSLPVYAWFVTGR